MNTHFLAPSAKAWLMALAFGLLTACGGGHATGEGEPATSAVAHSAPAQVTPSFQPTSSNPPSEQTVALQKEGGRLSSEELAQIAKTGVLPKAFEGPLLSGAEKVASSGGAKIAVAISPRTAAYRFYNTKTGAHFYTTSTTERDNVQATLPFMSFEGPAFYASATAVPGLSPVHRFYNTQTGVHFYTISEAERASVVANLPQFNYEGIAYYASTLPGTGYTPLYRFFYAAKGFHFYTNSLSERDTIIATLPQYSYEGVGYYVLGSDWKVPAIPHSGVASSNCYQAGSDTLVSCASAGALALNAQQDGHRAAINPMSYGGVPGHKPLDSCVLDQVTGLIWEVKTASGVRNGANTYTNLGNGAATDSSGYVAAINALQLCGFNDWRMPTVQELHGLVDFSVGGSGPMIRTTSFPNTQTGYYWAGDTALQAGGNGGSAWLVDFAYEGSISWTSKFNLLGVRLVRGAQWVGQRYVVGSASYPGDDVNNVVTDRKTGLTWRRCAEGATWAGATCTGTVIVFSHVSALAYKPDGLSGWRLPNVKELGSLVDVADESSSIDTYAFPKVNIFNYTTWTSSPSTNDSSKAHVVTFDYGVTGVSSRSASNRVRLISSPPLL